ncbi:unnamed protein product [Nezara viridula]|uniref:Uncharacterized protein n=1 Tax=Nezara viridula TaxID=85310 RepID=A0A9P0HR16_NEZVI|nr:unnamed protein product [Nezara viridula]
MLCAMLEYTEYVISLVTEHFDRRENLSYTLVPSSKYCLWTDVSSYSNIFFRVLHHHVIHSLEIRHGMKRKKTADTEFPILPSETISRVLEPEHEEDDDPWDYSSPPLPFSNTDLWYKYRDTFTTYSLPLRREDWNDRG